MEDEQYLSGAVGVSWLRDGQSWKPLLVPPSPSRPLLKTVDALHDMNYSQYITYKGVYERTKAALGGLRKAAGSHICLRQKLCQVR